MKKITGKLFVILFILGFGISNQAFAAVCNNTVNGGAILVTVINNAHKTLFFSQTTPVGHIRIAWRNPADNILRPGDQSQMCVLGYDPDPDELAFRFTVNGEAPYGQGCEFRVSCNFVKGANNIWRCSNITNAYGFPYPIDPQPTCQGIIGLSADPATVTFSIND